jgi:hypothetical protein
VRCAALAVLAAACGRPSAPAPATPTPAPAPATPAPPTTPAPKPLPPAPACAYANNDVGAILPSYALGVDGQLVCDLPSRVIVVDEKSVSSLARPDFKATRAPITKRDHLGNRCGDGPDGGHAGCSITYDRFWSSALGKGAYLEFGTNAGNVLFSGKREEECRESSRTAVVATCSTATHFALVKLEEPEAKGDACFHVRAHLFDATPAAAAVLDGDVDRARSTGDAWVYRFPGRAGGPDVELAFDRSTRTAALTVGDAREPCVAFRLSR